MGGQLSNHDDRRALSRHFGVPGSDGEPVQYSVDLGPLRLVVLDTTIPGADGGRLDDEQLGWLAGTLAETPDAPTLVAMHHPPFAIGIPAWDAIALLPEDRERLGELLGRHPQVLRVLTGHVHRAITTARAR